MSPSSRRAWIEMVYENTMINGKPVALLAEGVDRNPAPGKGIRKRESRPPRGGRG